MKAKEEAKELVYKYKYRIIKGVKIEQMTISLAKQCALICVDEIINSLWYPIHSSTFDEIRYYEKVKQEINKL
jgi:hypothetical protein